MASLKLASLLIKTLAKPIANQLKQQASQHETFRQVCISLAQWTHKSEVRLRTNLLGESPKNIKPLSETRAVQNGASNLAEGFLFAIGAGLILAETYRSSRSQAKRRDSVNDSIEELEDKVQKLTAKLEQMSTSMDENWEEQRTRQDELARILDRVIYIGLRGGWETLHNGGRGMNGELEHLAIPFSPLPLGLSSPPSTTGSDSSSTSTISSKSSDSAPLSPVTQQSPPKSTP